MIIESDSKILWKNKDINIIFNPVSCCNNTKGRNRFNSLLKREFNEVYNAWEEYLVGENPNKILSDVQLVKISDNKVILNAYCYNKKGDMDLLALTKTMVELFNLAEEYKLNIGIPYHLYLKNKFITTCIDLIISTIFSDCKSNVYYSKTHYNQRSN